MTDTFDIANFVAKVASVAKRISPLLSVSQASEDTCLVQFPGLANQVWVKAAEEGEKFRVIKNKHKDPRPTNLGQISPVGEGFLGEVLKNYIAEVGHPQI
jgi:hypothetical protein